MNYSPFATTSAIYDPVQMNPYAGVNPLNFAGLQNFAAKPFGAYSSVFGMGNPMGIPAINALDIDPTARLVVNAIATKIKNDWVAEEQIKQIGSKLLEPRHVEHLASSGAVLTPQHFAHAVAMDRNKDLLINGLLNHVVDERRVRRQEFTQQLSAQGSGFEGMRFATTGFGPAAFAQTARLPTVPTGIANCYQMANWI